MEQLTSSKTDDRPEQSGGGAGRDRTARQAALWATVVAVPLSLLVAFLLFARLSPDAPEAGPDPAGEPRPQSTAPVELPAPALADGPAVICRALLSRLPANVRDLAQRPVTAGSEQNAAYGDPPLTVACGVPPAVFPPTDDLWTVNRVCWHAAPLTAGAVVLTTVDREVPVRVKVPQAYEQPLQWVAPISDAVVASVRSATPGTIPAGCTP